MKYVKLTAKPNTWFKAGTEVYDYNCREDCKERITLEQWNEWQDCGFILTRGYRISENDRSENVPVGVEYFDGESCGIIEFEVEIVDKII
jgi:hypothetical protein